MKTTFCPSFVVIHNTGTQAERPATTEQGDLSKTIFTLLASVKGFQLYKIFAAAPRLHAFLYFKLLPTFFPE
jgi:hypothetical protein